MRMPFGNSTEATIKRDWSVIPIPPKKDTTRIANKVLKRKRVKAGLKTKALFMMMRMMQKKDWGSGEAEKMYWDKNGWLGKERPWK